MKVSWVFDVISPFSYLSLKQLPSLPSHVNVEFVPVLFAGLLDHYGQIGNAEIASKRRFTYRFALWRSRQLGIPMCLPPSHPFNPLMALRLIIAAGSDRRAVETVFDAVFMHGRDVSCVSVISDLSHALDVPDRQAALNDPAIKQRLRQNTEWAIARGVFGVPTFVIENEIFWGHDAFDMALGYLLDPEQFQDAEMQKIDTLPVGTVRPRSVRPPPSQ
jgi:2-hydroxychromene-2-carboxylate isomerase